MTYDAHANSSLKFETQQLHAGYDPTKHRLSKAVPVYQSAAFQLGSYERNNRINDGLESGDTYSRLSHPTAGIVERRIAALEGGSAAVAMSAGMAAISATFLTLASAGDEIVATGTLYGGTGYLLNEVLPDFGITTNWVSDPSSLDAYREAITPRTKAVHIEAIGNPSMNVVDIEGIAEIAHGHNIPLVIDATFATPFLLRPFEHGADIVCHSGTKYLCGHGTTLCGVVVESGRFDWNAGNFPQVVSMIESESPGEVDLSVRTAFTRSIRKRILGGFGGQISPQNAFLLLQGIETLSLRMEQHVDNALAVAQFLESHPIVREVSYPSLPSSPYYPLAQKYLPRGAGAMMAVRLHGGLDVARRVIERLRIFDFVANVGDAKSMVVHPYSSTHAGLSDDVLERAGVYQDGLRLSVGIEDIADLIADLEQALAPEINAN